MPKSMLLIGKYSIVEPMGLMFLAASIKRAGHHARILLLRDDGNDFISLAFQGEPFDFLGFSVYTGFHKKMFRRAEGMMELGRKIVIGGPHATYFSDDCRKYSDYVVAGEGLRAVKDILNGDVKPGMVFVPSLVSENKIPEPDREVIYNEYPELRGNRIKNVMTSFGCPYNCHYCFNNSYRKLYPHSFSVRQRQVDSVIEECCKIKLSYPAELIYFQDDCFGYRLEWLSEFASKYKAKVGIPFHCQIRPELASDDRLKLFKEAGCHGITMAIETSREDIRRDLLNRRMSNYQILTAARLIKGYGFKLRTEQMLGIPGTTIDDELDLLALNVEIRPDMAWSSVFAPYLGTTLGDYAKMIGMYDGDNDDLKESFFSDSKLKFDPIRLRKTNVLQRLFGIFATIPNGHQLARSFLDRELLNFDSLYQAVKNHIYDNCLYKT